MIEVFKKEDQAYGQFNNGEIIENKPIGFPTDGGPISSYSNLFYWAHAIAKSDSTIGLHPHKGFEIITFVISGSIKHYDTLIDKWIKLDKGDVQVIQSGSGISHSEFIQKNSSIFQIWFDPNIHKTLYDKPKYKDYKSNFFKIKNNKKTIIGKDSSLKIKSEDIEIFELKLTEDIILNLNSKKYYSIYLLSGKIALKEKEINNHDFIKISNENNISLQIINESNLFVIASPINVSYETY
ncbi:MAG: hypothetical protein HN522_01005 [Flavobacteriales bacterium]|jgi:quercetin 2,3-dioxygenase|nr:hypothetical protein [Flavobacteriales bacterium]MBT5090228.1 hypothetical protein [Flavobacteriales bacterium]